MVIVFFTFHNVSINTIGRLRDGHLKQFALHSTMFLLIQRCSICLSYCYTTLHSTMFLLIPCRSGWNIPEESNFTFHNVSINTGETSENCSGSGDTLHSTMFLLILIFHNDNIHRKYYFTFHNVSINTVKKQGSGYVYTSLYIPQCFY